ncbi:MAG: hypothetical protein HY904_09795 [Deltaproteobacteria bacterium]|nr:hypothetical protein [Deltaproteobacteria bacterium]
MRVCTVLLAVVVAWSLACARKEKERPPAALLEQAAVTTRDGGYAPEVELDLTDAGAVAGLWLTSPVDAPEGVHLGLVLLDAAGRALASDRAVVACVTAARAGERVRVPADGADDEATAVLAAARSARVTSATRAGGCLRPSLRVEALLRPAGG